MTTPDRYSNPQDWYNKDLVLAGNEHGEPAVLIDRNDQGGIDIGIADQPWGTAGIRATLTREETRQLADFLTETLDTP